MARANSWILPRSTCMVTGSPVLPIALLSTGIASSLAVVPNRARECSRRRRGREGLEYHKAIGIDPASDRAGPPRPVGTSRRAFRHEQRQSTTCCLWRFGCGARSGAGLRVEADGGADCQDDPGVSYLTKVRLHGRMSSVRLPTPGAPSKTVSTR